MRVKFILNGKDTIVETQSDRRVVDLLREDLGLTGVKECCGAGECGACTILVNGTSRLSCLMLAAQLEGMEVTTIEGVAPEGGFAIVQQTFIDHGAVQCGFCTPGMVLAVLDLLQRNPQPTSEEIRAGLSGNLCRCTGYQKIVEAVLAAAALLKGRRE
ncbi:(2Fe-2S)-binding protein [Sporomusa malonica]|uniref:Carbon-monoxide dehydrogenase small subunit n=1 Tax=Sporomusa malonica TaxID=112901 RepID=A0A1W2E6A8_9FIRM|nr:(2Fe-2S)-binding protein [Sporomusa malonica]SMD05301.1 carbon-monoxide dehydrogenase small subunit [Sporomusa malonica]